MSGGRRRGGGRSRSDATFLLVRPQERGDFAADEADEGARQHLVGLPSGVLEVVVGVSEHVEQSLNQFFILRGEERPLSIFMFNK